MQRNTFTRTLLAGSGPRGRSTRPSSSSRDPSTSAMYSREMSRRLRATDELLFRARMGDAPPAPEGLGAPT